MDKISSSLLPVHDQVLSINLKFRSELLLSPDPNLIQERSHEESIGILDEVDVLRGKSATQE